MALRKDKTDQYIAELLNEIKHLKSHNAALLTACKSMLKTLDCGTFGHGTAQALKHQIVKMKSAIEQAKP